jgi:hypothetical protein
MVVDANLGTAQAGEVFLRLIGASAVEAVRLLMVDTLHFKTVVQAIPSAAFVRVNGSALRYYGASAKIARINEIASGLRPNYLSNRARSTPHHEACRGLVRPSWPPR